MQSWKYWTKFRFIGTLKKLGAITEEEYEEKETLLLKDL